MICPKVYVVILNWNGKDDTVECLNSLKKLSYPNFRVIVVDNASTDGSQELIKRTRPDVELIENSANLGCGGGNNVGIREALKKGADYVFLLNNDTIVDSNLLSILVEVGESSPQIGIIGPKIYPYSEPDKIWAAGAETVRFSYYIGKLRGFNQRDKGQYDFDGEVDFLLTCGVMIKREVFELIGLLDADYFYTTEDFDFCLRARKTGFKVFYVSRAMMWHKVAASVGGMGYTPTRKYYSERGKVIFMKKHAKWWQWPKFLLFAFGSIPYVFVRESLRGNQKAAIAKAKGIYDGFRIRKVVRKIM